MKFLKFLSPIFILVYMNVQAEIIDEFDVDGCENVQAGVIDEFRIDANYIAQIVCDNTMLLNLVKNGKKVFSIDTKESCKNNVSFDANFFGRKAIYTSLSPCTGASPTSSESIYIVDTAERKIILAGMMPIIANRQDDGTFLYETLTPYAKVKITYSFTDDNRIIDKRSSMLIFDGSVCIRKRDGLGSYVVDEDCDAGIAASQNTPVCVESYYETPPKIVSLDECDIKKEEVSDLRE